MVDALVSAGSSEDLVLCCDYQHIERSLVIGIFCCEGEEEADSGGG